MYFLEHQKENPDFLNEYLKYYCFIEFASTTTVNEKYFDLRTFFRYIKYKFHNQKFESIDEFKMFSIDDITLNDMNNVKPYIIDDFIFFLRNTLDNSPETRNRKLATLRKFFRYLFNNNLIDNNPTESSKMADVKKRQPKYLSLKQSKALLSNTINTDTRNKIRNYTICCLFLNCGLRLSELVGINKEDLKLDDMTIKVKGKGNKERIIYLNDATKESIEEYLKIRQELPKTNSEYNALFLSERNKRISRRTVQYIVEQELDKLYKNERNGLHTHSLRHTTATLLYNENGTDIMLIKEILGHENISSTEIYTHINNKKLKEIMEKYAVSSILEKKENLENGK